MTAELDCMYDSKLNTMDDELIQKINFYLTVGKSFKEIKFNKKNSKKI